MDVISAWAATFARKHPDLRVMMKKAHMRDHPATFVKKSLTVTFYASLAIALISFLFVSKFEENLLWVPIVTVVSGFMIFFFFLNTPLGIIRKREREIDQEVLFVGRYLLVKLQSGEPLYNSLIDASRSYGTSAKYIKEIVDDVTTGKPIEDAIEYAWEFNSSEKFKRILWQILSALRTGTEMAPVLKTTLKSITVQQVLEVKEYGKKLNTFMMFYLIVACIMPSLGLTMLVVISSFIKLELQESVFLVLLFFLAVVQTMFLILIKSARPAVNL